MEVVPIGELGASDDAGFQDGGSAIDEFHSAGIGVVIVPTHVDDGGPEIEGLTELLGENGIGRGDFDAEVHGVALEEFALLVTGREVALPVGHPLICERNGQCQDWEKGNHSDRGA